MILGYGLKVTSTFKGFFQMSSFGLIRSLVWKISSLHLSCNYTKIIKKC